MSYDKKFYTSDYQILTFGCTTRGNKCQKYEIFKDLSVKVVRKIKLRISYLFRSLKCTRIRIHIQLFISFALNNIMWIIWYKEVIPNTIVLLQNEVSIFLVVFFCFIDKRSHWQKFNK